MTKSSGWALFRNLVSAASLLAGSSWAALSAQDIQVAPHGILASESGRGIASIAFSDEGTVVVGDERGYLQFWNLESQRSLGTATVNSGVLLVRFLPGDRSFVAVDDSGTVTIVDLLKGPGQTFKTQSRPLKAALDAGKTTLAIATKAGRIELFDLKAMMPLGQIDAQDRVKDLLFLGFDRLNQQLVAIDRLARVSSWNPATLKLLREITLSGGELHGSKSVIHSGATNRAANVFVVGLEETAITKGASQRTAVASPGGFGRPSFGGVSGMGDMQRNVDLMRQHSAIVFDWNSGMEVKRVRTQTALDQVALGPGNDHLAAIAEDGRTITLIDLRKGEIGSSIASSEKLRTLAISDDNRWIAAGSKGGSLSVWKLKFREEANAARPNLPTMAGRIRTTSGAEPALKPGVPTRIAILTFEAKGMPQDVADVCLNSLSNSLANLDYITLIERKQIDKVVAEQKFQNSDLSDESTSIQVGKLLGADRVLLCGIGRLGSTMVLTARILHVETGKVIRGREVVCEECRDQDIFDAIKLLASTIAQ